MFALTKSYICDQCSAAEFRHIGEALYIFTYHGRQLVGLHNSFIFGEWYTCM